MQNATILAMVAGMTPVANMMPKAAGISPTMSSSMDRKTVPDNNVPKPIRMAYTAKFFANLLIKYTTAKKIKPVTSLSMMFGMRDPGMLENNPERTPVTIVSINVSRIVGNRMIPTNIIVNIISGLMPPPIGIGGITKYNAVPIPTKRAISTKFFVFILISPPLNSAQLS